MNKKYKELAKNTVLFTISSFGTKILTFLLVPLYTSILTTEDYGVADVILASVNLLIYILTLNISSSVQRFAMEKFDYKKDILTIGLRFSALGTLVLGISILICYKLHIVRWEPYCYLFLFLLFLFTNVNEILNNYLRAIDKIVSVVISGLLVTSVMITSNIVFLLVLDLGIIGYLGSNVLGLFVSTIYCFIVIKPKNIFEKIHENSEKKIKGMLQYSIPMSFNGLAWWINANLDKYFITAIVGPSYNGIYAVASKIPTILSTVLNIFMQAWGISAIKEYDKDDTDGFFSKTYELVNAFLVVLCSILILLNIPLAKIMFAKEFFVAWKCSSILLIAGVFSGIGGFVGSIFSAVKDSKSYAMSTIYGALVNVVLNIVLIPTMGIIGAGIATVLSYAVVLIVRLIRANKYIKWNVNIGKNIIGYCLLVMQVFFEHRNGHMYLGQMIVLGLLILIYRKAFIRMFDMCNKIIRKNKYMKRRINNE